MANPSTPPSSEYLAKILRSDIAREAVETIRGFDWQRWLSVERWLGLTNEEAIWIEWGEDLTIAKFGNVQTIQAKNLNSRITLGQKKIREFLSEALLQPSTVKTIFWTSAKPGLEQGNPFGEPGINYWSKVVSGEASGDKLKRFLTKSGRLASDAAQLLEKTPLENLPILFAKIEWLTEEVPIGDLKQRVLSAVESRLSQLGILRASILREDAAARLFEFIAEVSIRPDRKQRRLTRPDLDEHLVKQYLVQLMTSAPTIEAVLANQTEHQPEFTEALERDLARRYRHALQRSLFSEANKKNEFLAIAREILEGRYSTTSPSLRRRIFLRASRSTAARGEIAEAEQLLSNALSMNGPDTDLPARARLLAAKGDADRAIQILRDELDPDCRSTLLSILANYKVDALALDWLSENSLSTIDLTGIGVFTLSQIYLGQNDFDSLSETLCNVTQEQFSDSPYLYLLRGTVHFASILSIPNRQTALSGIPLDARFAEPILPDPDLITHLDAAIADLQQAKSIVSELGLRQAFRVVAAYQRWCEILHPSRKDKELARLRLDMAELQTAVRDLQFALAYDPDFDPKPLANLLKKREELGGLDDDELRAALVLRLHSDDPQNILDFIGKHRTRLELAFPSSGIIGIEIQALAKAKDTTSARLLLSEHKEKFPAWLAPLLEVEIAKAEGSDAVAEHKRVFENTNSPEALRALVGVLAQKNDRHALAVYAEKLYERTNDPEDISMAARALADIGDDENFLRIVQMRTPEQ